MPQHLLTHGKSADVKHLECDGQPVHVRMRIVGPDGLDINTPMGLQPLTRATIGRDALGVFFCVELAGASPGAAAPVRPS